MIPSNFSYLHTHTSHYDSSSLCPQSVISATTLNSKTPKADSEDTEIRCNTPLAKGSANKSHTDDTKKNDAKAYHAYLMEDWSQRVEIPFDSFCAHLLHTSITDNKNLFKPDRDAFQPSDPNQVREWFQKHYSSDYEQYAPLANHELARHISSQRRYKDLKNYYRRAGGERLAYEPLANLINYIIEELRKHRLGEDGAREQVQERLLLVLADRNQPIGAPGKNFPDFLAIREHRRLTVDAKGVTQDRSTNKGQKACHFGWCEPLFFVELTSKKLWDEDFGIAKDDSGKPSFEHIQLITNIKSDPSPLALTKPAPPLGSSKDPKSRKRMATEIDEDSESSNLDQQPLTSHPLKRAKIVSAGQPKLDSNVERLCSSSTLINSKQRSHQDEDKCGNAQYDETDDMKKYHVKCTRYALHMLSYGGIRSFVLGILIRGKKLQVTSYQRSSIISSQEINFLDDEYDIPFIGLIEALEKMEDLRFGYGSPLVIPRTEEPGKNWERLLGATLKFPVAPSSSTSRESIADISIMKVLYMQRAVLCRGTPVFVGEVANLPPDWERMLCGSDQHVESEGSTNTNKTKLSGTVIVKVTTAAATRKSESELINEARTKAEENPLWHWMKDRLPEVLAVHAPNEADEHEMRSAFALSDVSALYELRLLRVVVFAPLEPIITVEDPIELLCVYIDLIEAHKFLVKECDTLHRDVSIDNLMVRKKIDKDGILRRIGVINDFDLAITISDEIPPHRQRTGTQPFMAYELLEHKEVRHYPRHDLESFFYVMLHHTTHYDLDKKTGKIAQIRNPPYAEWAEVSLSVLRDKKATFWMNSNPVNYVTPHFFLVFASVIVNFKSLIKRGMNSCLDYIDEQKTFTWLPHKRALHGHTTDFNYKTLGGNLTHDTVLASLNEDLARVAISDFYKVRIRDYKANFGGVNEEKWERDSPLDRRFLRSIIGHNAKRG